MSAKSNHCKFCTNGAQNPVQYRMLTVTKGNESHTFYIVYRRLALNVVAFLSNVLLFPKLGCRIILNYLEGGKGKRT